MEEALRVEKQRMKLLEDKELAAEIERKRVATMMKDAAVRAAFDANMTDSNESD